MRGQRRTSGLPPLPCWNSNGGSGVASEEVGRARPRLGQREGSALEPTTPSRTVRGGATHQSPQPTAQREGGTRTHTQQDNGMVAHRNHHSLPVAELQCAPCAVILQLRQHAAQLKHLMPSERQRMRLISSVSVDMHPASVRYARSLPCCQVLPG